PMLEASSSSPESARRIQIEAEYPDIAGSMGEAATATSVSIPILLQESDLALDGSDLSQLTFKSTAVVLVWRPQTAIRAALEPDQSYIWLGATQALKGKPLARLDLTRARLTAYRSDDLLRLAFLFADVYLEVRPRSLKIVPASSTCRVLEREAALSVERPE